MSRIVVYHGGYGCDTGCCGHYVRLTDDQGETVREQFEFTHPYLGDEGDDPLQWAKELVADVYGQEHVADLVWDECKLVDD